jgi:coenzyme Q-binding protein COQ10
VPKYQNKVMSIYSPEQLFSLVMDVEKYPDFLPWCIGARILTKNSKTVTAQLAVKYKNFTETYTSEITFNYPNKIIVQQTVGPFKYLYNEWQFIKIDEDRTELHFKIDCKFKSIILENIASLSFSNTVQKVTQAFLDRAKECFGNLT